MDIQQNTEFILNKIDSIMTQATPYLEKGSEAVVKYKVNEVIYNSVSWFIVSHFIFIMGLFLVITSFKHYINNEVKSIMFFSIGIISTCIGFVSSVIFWSDGFPRFLLAINNPELYTIFNLLGK